MNHWIPWYNERRPPQALDPKSPRTAAFGGLKIGGITIYEIAKTCGSFGMFECIRSFVSYE